MVFLVGHVLFEYKGALFWKMTAGMGDVVIAPAVSGTAQARCRVRVLPPRRRAASRRPAAGRRRDHDRPSGPTRRRRRPLRATDRRSAVCPSSPTATRRAAREPTRRTATPGIALRSSATTPKPESLRRGVDFDHVVLAVSVGMIPVVATELIADRPEWREMTTHVRTVATQAFQIWLRPDESDAGLAPTRGRRQRLPAPVRDLGVDAADAVGRGLARGRSARHRRLLLRQPERAVAAERAGCATICIACAGRCMPTPTTTWTATSACSSRMRILLASARG